MTILSMIFGEGVTLLEVIVGTSLAVVFVAFINCLVWKMCDCGEDE